MSVRVRIAPSPTGAMHLGTTRTALFNWLYARRHGGTFIVRIDDTDTERSTPEFEADILGGLRWLGLDWDEGVEVGGPFGEYRQSARYDRYRQAAATLVEVGIAYRCFCTPAELDDRRKAAEAAGRPPGYDGRCRLLEGTEADRRGAAGAPFAIRFAMPRPGKTTFTDLVRSEVTFDHQHVDDFVILRSDRTPTYHLASTVDDVDYRISHVARGEDLLPSTPRHIQLTLALGGEVPVYAHLPLIMGTDGKRLSKRHGAQGITEYRQMGYLPEAIFNFVALMSWSIGDDITIFSPEQAVAAFDLGDVSSNPAVFDADKLLWLNGEYMRSLPVDDFSTRVRPFLEAGLDRPLADREWATFTKVAPVVQERVKLLSEAADQVRFLFVEDLDYDQESWSKVMTPESATVLGAARERLTDLMPFDKETVETALRGMLEELGMNAKKGLQPIRVAVTGSSVSPPLFESIAALGKERTLSRLTATAARLTT